MAIIRLNSTIKLRQQRHLKAFFGLFREKPKVETASSSEKVDYRNEFTGFSVRLHDNSAKKNAGVVLLRAYDGKNTEETEAITLKRFEQFLKESEMYRFKINRRFPLIIEKEEVGKQPVILVTHGNAITSPTDAIGTAISILRATNGKEYVIIESKIQGRKSCYN